MWSYSTLCRADNIEIDGKYPDFRLHTFWRRLLK